MKKHGKEATKHHDLLAAAIHMKALPSEYDPGAPQEVASNEKEEKQWQVPQPPQNKPEKEHLPIPPPSI